MNGDNSMKIEVLEIRFVSSDKSLKAFCDIKLGDIVIRDFRVFKENGRRPYIRSPFSAYKDQKGQLRFRPIVILPNEMIGEVDLAILNAYQGEKEKKDGRQNSR